MTVENATYISDFNASLPAAPPATPDSIKEGDNHIRLWKTVFNNTLSGDDAGLDGFVDATEDDLNNIIGIVSNIQAQLTDIFNSQIPLGGIIPFNGLITNITSPFSLCDGANGTPDLVNMFVYPNNVEGDLDDVGGSDNDIIVEHSHTATHGHSGTTGSAGAHGHNFTSAASGVILDPDPNSGSTGVVSGATEVEGLHTHSTVITPANISTATAGVSLVDRNIPPYVYLAFMMRIV